MINFSESGHPVFRGTSAFERGFLRSNEGGKLSIHFCGGDKAVEAVLRSIISVNQLSIYGAVAGMCEELASRISGCSASTGRFVAKDKPETMFLPTDLSTTTNPLLTNDQARGDLLREYKQKSANLQYDLRLIRLCPDAGFMKTFV